MPATHSHSLEPPMSQVIQLIVYASPGLGAEVAGGAGAADGQTGGERAGGHGATILSPSDLSFKMSRGVTHHGGSKTEMSLQANQMIEAFVSYNDAKLGVEILDSLQRVAREHAGREQSAAPTSPSSPSSPSALAGSSSAAASARALSTGVAEGGGAGAATPLATIHEGAPSRRGVAAAGEVTVSAAMQVDGIRLVLINDYNQRSVPLASCVLTPLALSGSGTMKHLMVESEIGAAVDLYVRPSYCAPSLIRRLPTLFPYMVPSYSFSHMAPSSRAPSSPPPPTVDHMPALVSQVQRGRLRVGAARRELPVARGRIAARHRPRLLREASARRGATRVQLQLLVADVRVALAERAHACRRHHRQGGAARRRGRAVCAVCDLQPSWRAAALRARARGGTRGSARARGAGGFRLLA